MVAKCIGLCKAARSICACSPVVEVGLWSTAGVLHYRGMHAAMSGLLLDKAPPVSAAVHGFLKSAAAELASSRSVSVEMTSSLQVARQQSVKTSEHEGLTCRESHNLLAIEVCHIRCKCT